MTRRHPCTLRLTQLLALAAALSSAALAQQIPPSPQLPGMTPNLAYPGNDISTVNGGNANSCAQACSIRARCKVWTFNTNNGGVCHLKSAAGAPLANACCTSGTKAATQIASQPTLPPANAGPGYQVPQQPPAPPPLNSPENAPPDTPMNSPGAAPMNSPVAAPMISGSGPQYAPSDGPGAHEQHPVAPSQPAPPPAPSTITRLQSALVGIAVNRISSTGANVSGNHAGTSSAPPAASLPGMSPFNLNTAFPGADLTATHGGDPNSCAQACGANVYCRAWTFNTSNGGVCHLKSKVAKTVTNACCTSGKKLN